MAIDLFTIGPITVHGYGLMIGLGFLAAVLVGCFISRKIGLSEDHFINLAIFVLLFGFIGGKLMYVIVNFKQFLTAPMAVLGSEGFVVYGGVITGVLTIYVYCRIKKIDFLTYIDLMTTSVAINQMFGRLGCFLAGCCYGRETDSPIGVIFPEGCIAPAGVRILPTQLFMAAGDLLMFILLVILTFRKLKPGIRAAVYLFLYSVGRFIVEFFRGDLERGTVGALSTSQFIGIWIALLAIVFFVYVWKKKEKTEEKIEEKFEEQEKQQEA